MPSIFILFAFDLFNFNANEDEHEEEEQEDDDDDEEEEELDFSHNSEWFTGLKADPAECDCNGITRGCCLVFKSTCI